MYTIIVKSHIMIAHSLKDPFFGPAQNLHGATYEVEIHISTEKLNEKQVVIDIGEAEKILKETLDPLAYQNLDTLVQFEGVLTTTEFLAKYIHDTIKQNLAKGLSLKIVLHETPTASAVYEER